MKKWLKVSLLLLLCCALAFTYACGEQTEDPSQGDVTPPDDGSGTETVCTVTFDSQGGTPVDPITVNAGQKITKPADPTREGYIFDRWLTPTGGVFSFGTKINESLTLTAQWTELGEAVPPEIADQPSEAVADPEMGGTFKITINEARGYKYTFKWYLNDRNSTEGGELLEGQTGPSAAIPGGLNKNKTYYLYAEITGTRSATGVSATVMSGLTRVKFQERAINILVVGSGVLVRNVSGQSHDMAAFLQQLGRADGRPLIVDTVAIGSNYNIWETGLVGTDYANITAKFDQRVYDYVVVQLGRDYVLSSSSVVNNEKLAANNIYDKAKEYNPNVKMVTVVSYARQDTTTKYYTDVYKTLEPAATTRAQVSQKITGFWETIREQFSFEYIEANLNDAFEAAIKLGINPYVDDTNDFAGVDGSYLGACLMYAAMFNKSPLGIMCFETDSMKVNPETGVQLQNLAQKLVLGKSSGQLPDVSNYTKFVDIYKDWIEIDINYKNDPIYKYPTPTVATRLPKSETEVEKENVKVFVFGGFPMAYNGAANTFLEMARKNENLNISLTSYMLSHTSSATTYNLFEFFPMESRGDINDMTYSSLGSNLPTVMAKGFDYLILQTGRDVSLATAEAYQNNIISACKIVKLAAEANPDVKVILVAPYAHANNFTDLTSRDVMNMQEHADLINGEAEDIKKAILNGKYAKNVQIVSLADAFLSYADGDEEVIKKDLYALANGTSGRANVGNRANAKGAYLAAATMYASIFGKSPVGLDVLGSSGTGYSANILDGAKLLELQKLAHKAVFGKNYSGTDGTHTITFFSNGGSEVAPITASTGAKIAQPKDPTNGELVFAGWFYDAALTSRYSFMQSTMAPCDMTLYAGWAKPAGSGRSYGQWHDDIQKVLIVGSGPISRSGSDTGEFLQAIAKKSGRELYVQTISYGNNYNIWETGLVGEGASKVEALCKEHEFDTIVLMLGRDNVLVNTNTATSERNMINNIYDIASRYNENAQILLYSNYARQDKTTNYYVNTYSQLGIDSREKHVAAIEKYIDEVCAYISMPFRTVNVNAAFDLCINRGILTPYGSVTMDYQDVYGAYLSAACVFAEMFHESPFGLLKFESANGQMVLPSYGIQLQAIAQEAVLGEKAASIPEIDDKTWVDPDTGRVSAAGTPVNVDGTKVPVYFEDETVEGATNIFLFGGYSFGSYNMLYTLRDMISASTKTPINYVTAALGHGGTATTYNVYELFASSARASIDDMSFATGNAGQTTYRKLNSTRFDYVIIQTGRDFSLASQSSRTYIINSAVKIAKLAVEKNPDVKIVLVGPYGHMASFDDFANLETPITTNKAQVTAIDDELAAVKEAVMGVTKNVTAVSLGSLFNAYSSDTDKVRADLYREADDVQGRANTGNRANAKGSYLAASAVFAAATGKSPTGLGCFGYSSSSVNGTLEKNEAIAMQKLASKFVLGDEGKVPDTFDICIDPQNGQAPTIIKAKEGDSIEMPAEPTREGYTFKGWYTDYNYTTAVNFDTYTVPFGGASVVAKWKLIIDTSKTIPIESNAKPDTGKSHTILAVGSGVLVSTNNSTKHDMVNYLAELLDQGGYSTEIRRVFLGNTYNLWETGLVGENYSKVEEQLTDGKVDTLILMGSRDYVLTSSTTGSSEINAANNMAKLAAQYNPNVKVIYVVSHARQDYTSTYYQRFADIDVYNREEHAYAISEHVKNVTVPGFTFSPIVIDANGMFEYTLKNTGINPWQNSTADFAGAEGDYLMAAGVYAGITGKSPVGLLRFSSVANGNSVRPTIGVLLQKIAAQFVLGIDIADSPSVDVDDSYVDRRSSNILFIGGRTLNDNAMPDTLDFFLRQIQRTHMVKSLASANSLAEAVESTAVKVEFNYSAETYDYLVLELGRDDVLYDEAAAAAEAAAIAKLVELGKANNPAIKVVLVAPAARQNTTGQYFRNQVKRNGISTRVDYAKLITAYAEKLCGEEFILCDIAAGAEKAAAQGVSVYANSVSDYLSEDGSYFAAAMVYNSIFGGMADSITYVGKANAQNAQILKQIANGMFE